MLVVFAFFVAFVGVTVVSAESPPKTCPPIVCPNNVLLCAPQCGFDAPPAGVGSIARVCDVLNSTCSLSEYGAHCVCSQVDSSHIWTCVGNTSHPNPCKCNDGRVCVDRPASSAPETTCPIIPCPLIRPCAPACPAPTVPASLNGTHCGTKGALCSTSTYGGGCLCNEHQKWLCHNDTSHHTRCGCFHGQTCLNATVAQGVESTSTPSTPCPIIFCPRIPACAAKCHSNVTEANVCSVPGETCSKGEWGAGCVCNRDGKWQCHGDTSHWTKCGCGHGKACFEEEPSVQRAVNDPNASGASTVTVASCLYVAMSW